MLKFFPIKFCDIFLALSLLLTALSPKLAHSESIMGRSSLGIGLSENTLGLDSWGPGAFGASDLSNPLGFHALAGNSWAGVIFAKLYIWQSSFQKLLTKALLAFQHNAHGGLWLALIAFLYGLLHSLGPGHGKMIVSSYVLANKTSIKRGLLLAFAAAFCQASMAIIIILSVYYFLPFSWTQMVIWLSNASFLVLALLGGLFLKRALLKLKNKPLTKCKEQHNSCSCRHHIDPQSLEHNFSAKTSLLAILAVGARPCSGALLIMSFAAISQQYKAGIYSVFAMGLGTFMTVATLAMVSVKARHIANFYLENKLNRHGLGRKLLIYGEIALAAMLLLSAALLAYSNLLYA